VYAHRMRTLTAISVRRNRRLATTTLAAASWVLASAHPAHASGSTLVLTSGKSALVGSAYASDRQDFLGGQCVTGDTKPTGIAESSFQLDHTVSETDLSSQLGFGLDTRARFGVVEASLAANFLSRSTSNAFSMSAIYSATYNMQPQKVDTATLRLLQPGVDAKASGSFLKWNETCGDSFVDEIRRGAKLFFSIRIDFSSLEQKKEFSAKVAVSGPLWGVKANIDSSSQSLTKSSTVTVSAYQLGGDPTKLTEVFGAGDGGLASYKECTVGTFSECGNVIVNAIKYASDTQHGFPSQLTLTSSPGPSVISYGVSPYIAYGIQPLATPMLAQLVIQAREDLGRKFEQTYQQYLTASRLLGTHLTPDKAHAVEIALTQIKGNLTGIQKTADACYNTPADCPSAESHLVLTPVDPSALLPDSFRTLCTATLHSDADDPIRRTVNVLVNIIQPGQLPHDPDDCAIYERLLRRLTVVDLKNKGLVDVSALSGLENVDTLILDDNAIVDLSSLATMPSLQRLSAAHNRIEDLSPLSHAQNLSVAILGRNRITSVSSLSGDAALEILQLGGNPITSASPLAELRNLIFLGLAETNVADLNAFKTPYKLKCVALQGTSVSDGELARFDHAFPGTVAVRDKGTTVLYELGAGYACKSP
jgi:hypothetical protein